MKSTCRPRYLAHLFAITIACVLISSSKTTAADPSDYLSSNGQHRLFSADSPPGMIGYGRTLGRSPVSGYFQPVAFNGPDGVKFSLGQANSFGVSESGLMAGLLIGPVYRFQITNIPLVEGAELYPSIELIDRTYPPPGLATLYPIQISIDEDDLALALNGQMVTKVIYLEDPQTAFPVAEKPTTGRTVDIGEKQDPLATADQFGRPVAIIRIGSLAPPTTSVLMPQFFFGSPAWAPIFQTDQELTQ